MKLRQRPEDFQVEELTNACAGASGEFAFYRLDKTGWTTPDALLRVRQHWRLHYRDISYGGLKDRHAVTSQYLTIYRGPTRDFVHPGFTLKYLGQRAEPYTSRNIAANRFTIVVRDLTLRQAEQAAQIASSEITTVGVPNYFDDQRFGSVAANRDFVARRMVCADWEGALWLALAAPYEFDRASDKRLKQTLRAHWGQWQQLRQMLPRSHARSLISYLSDHPLDYKGAVARLRPELRGLYVAAYQSWLWNRMLSAWLKQQWPDQTLVCMHGKREALPAPRQVPEQLQDLWHDGRLPLPSSRLKTRGDEWWLPLLDDILRQEGVRREQLRIPGLDRPFFARGERAISFRPQQLRCELSDDELQPGRVKLTLRFDLPRGSYATLVVKRLMADAPVSGKYCI